MKKNKKKRGEEVEISTEARDRLKVVAAKRKTTMRALIEGFAYRLKV